MCDTPFKTPLPYNTPRSYEFYTPKENSDKSDSEESTSSTGESKASYNSADLSIVAVFDDLMRLVKQRRHDKIENAFISFAEDIKDMWSHWQESVVECRRLQSLINKKTEECSELENHLKVARKLLDKEKLMTKQAERERNQLERQISQIQDIFHQKDLNVLPSETREKLDMLNLMKRKEGSLNHNLSAIQEINSTGSILSDFSYSRSEDDLDNFTSGPVWKNHRASTGGVPEPAIKKRRSSSNKFVEVNATDTVRATTTLTVPKEGPITATSVIESVPKPYGQPDPVVYMANPSAPPASLIFESWAKGSPAREKQYKQHVLQQKTIVMPDTCGPCERRIRFGKTALKCKECRVLCHLECRDKLPLACVPLAGTPNSKNQQGIVSDYTPTTAPMVPGILIHCVNEIEAKGLNELGIYRIPGAERDVKQLKEKFLKGRGIPCLSQVDIHVICGTVKDFLRSLNEPIITFGLWRSFVSAIEQKDRRDTDPALYHAISQLPQPNRDTLAYMVLHLQKISEAKECKMPIGNLAKIFGPTIVGYSCEDPDPGNLLTETRQQAQVMEALLYLPSEYWSSFIDVSPITSNNLRQTPSTDSLLRSATKNSIFTPNRNNLMKRKQKFFATPPMYK
ncbi:unnamed protein product [Brassicogethes aeneus]|uniref:Rac GTPase-activating protein 1 n=1 Tax=Brassicogethes aeneus TaxID=1431903 RepID=A0A9P0FAP4_BRAAE|nr:unnamed protein product [Brassicogethes aeneus]